MAALMPLWPGQTQTGINYISAPPGPDFLARKRRRLVILGSTGSIGRNGLRVAEAARERIEITGLAAGRNISLLIEQAERWRPAWLAVADRALAEKLAAQLPRDYRPEILHGEEGYGELARLTDADLILSAQAGSAGLGATLGAAAAGKVIALANKESLVMAGGLIRATCARTGASILPVDSEHYAIFQCSAGRGLNVKSLVLTASGGPFLHKKCAEMQKASLEDALNHPAWKMGQKISIDSATMMNKGLEFIEAMHLYGMEPDQIRILIHPQAIVHSLVELADNSQIAQLAVPDMRLAIGACLLWPEAGRAFVSELNLAAIRELSFLEPDLDKFRCLGLALAAARSRPDPAWRKIGLNPACIALNAANEAAVELCLAGKCRFGDIARLVEAALAPWLANDNANAQCGVAPKAGGNPLDLVRAVADATREAVVSQRRE